VAFVDKKICIVTGANSGIGKQAAIQMAEKGYQVIIGCRNKERGEKALKEIIEVSKSSSVEFIQLDLSLKSCTKNFADEVIKRYERIDVLIHNAAIFDIAQKKAMYTAEGHETVWMINHINPIYLTYLLLDRLKAAEQGRIITISSKGLLAKPFLKVDLKDPEYRDKKFNMTNAYYQSKRAQVMFTYYLADQLKDTKVTVNSIRVTAVKIDISRYPNISRVMKWAYKQKSKKSITPQQMAKTYTYLASMDEVSNITGKYYDEKNNQVKSNKYSMNAENIKAVMDLSFTFIDKEGF
jgi:NAD(P)-dependent dehydrogenase (short-subunit alcohol dehydrogenase family)